MKKNGKNSTTLQKDSIFGKNEKKVNSEKTIPRLLKAPLPKNNTKHRNKEDSGMMSNLSQNLTQIVAEHPSQVVSSIRHKVQDLSSDNLTSAIALFKNILEENDLSLSQNSQLK